MGKGKVFLFVFINSGYVIYIFFLCSLFPFESIREKTEKMKLTENSHSTVWLQSFVEKLTRVDPQDITLKRAPLMVCNSGWRISENPQLVWHPARLIKEWGCVDLSMDTLHLDIPWSSLYQKALLLLYLFFFIHLE